MPTKEPVEATIECPACGGTGRVPARQMLVTASWYFLFACICLLSCVGTFLLIEWNKLPTCVNP